MGWLTVSSSQKPACLLNSLILAQTLRQSIVKSELDQTESPWMMCAAWAFFANLAASEVGFITDVQLLFRWPQARTPLTRALQLPARQMLRLTHTSHIEWPWVA